MATDLDLVRGGLDALPLFPLPDGVLLPHELLPLHIFEPRYRALIADVLEHGRPLAVGRLAAGWEGDYEGRPAVEPVFGVGVVTRSELLPDGCYNVLLKGVLRVRLVRELPAHRAWREVQAEELVDEPADAAVLADGAESLRRMLLALCSARPGPAANALAHLATRAGAPAALADVVAAALFTDFERRKQVLESQDPAERLELARSVVAELLVDVAGSDDSSPRLRN